MSSINYYNQYAETYIKSTFRADMSLILEQFVQHIPSGGRILDLGCGSGRDSLWFKSRGYSIIALDGSESMIQHCKKYLLADEMVHSRFETYHTDLKFDGIWACASLLHISRDALPQLIQKYVGYLNPHGVFFMSFKSGKEDTIVDGRTFTNFTKETLSRLLSKVHLIDIVTFIHTQDVREEREKERWISVIVKKSIFKP
jgi:2-polyprenyl-3-methyl-5-hydroxy-6-metoxy-1,4-benzoquinol methylase